MRSGRASAALVAAAVLAIFGAAFWGGAYISDRVFDGLPHVEDEHAFLFQAKVLAAARLYVPSPADPEFFPTQFVVDHAGKRFGKYPPGYPAILSLGILAGQPRLVNPILGALTLVLVFLIGRELYGTGTGLLAAALGLVSPFFLMISGSFMSHSTTAFFLVLFLLFFVKARRSPGLAFPLLAGVCLGMAFITRQLTALGVAVPFVLYGLIDLRRGKLAFLKYCLMVLGFAPFAGFLLYYNYVLTGDPFLNPYELWWSFDKIGFGPWESLRQTLEMRWTDLQTNFWLLSDYLFGWPGKLSLAFALVPFVLVSRRLWDWLLLGAAVSLMIAYMAYWTSGEMYGPRYFYETLPLLLLLAARGLSRVEWLLRSLLDRLGFGGLVVWRRRSRLGPLWEGGRDERSLADGSSVARLQISRLTLGQVVAPAALGLVLAVLVYAGLTGFLVREMDRYKGWYDVSPEPLQAVRMAGLHNALVFVSTKRTWTEFASVDVANSPDYNSDVVFAKDREGKNGELARLYPGRKYYLLVGDALSPYIPPE